MYHARGPAVNNLETGGRMGSVEELERRQMLAAAPPTIGTDHVLHVDGTEFSDRIVVSRILANGKDEVKVALNKRRYYFRTDDVERIVVDAGADDDYVAVA